MEADMVDSRRYEKEIGFEGLEAEPFMPSMRHLFAPGGFREDDGSAPGRLEVFSPEGFPDDEAAASPYRKRSFLRANWLVIVVLLNLASVSVLFFFASGGHPLDHARRIVQGLSRMVAAEPAGETPALAAPRSAARVPANPREEFRRDPDGVWRNHAARERTGGE
jgi:hypothetical protein